MSFETPGKPWKRSPGSGRTLCRCSWVACTASHTRSDKQSCRRWSERLRPGGGLAEWLVDLEHRDRERVQVKVFGAALAFSVLGSAARPAIPDLLKMADDRKSTSTAWLALYALANVGEDALPYLIGFLEGTNNANRVESARYIGSFPLLRTNAAPAIPALLRCLQDKDAGVRCAAALALGRAALKPEVVVPALVATYQTAADWNVRRSCVSALGRFGPRARDADGLLVAALSDPKEIVRQSATNALKRVAPEVLTNAAAR
jgi:HEAT repeat protein